MADSLQPDIPSRSPQMSEGIANRQGLVLPPGEVEEASTAMDELFKSQMGREPGKLDDVPTRDRDKASDATIETAFEMPELEEPLENEAEKSVEKPAPKPDEKPDSGETPRKKSFLDELLPDDEIIPLAGEKAPEEEPVAEEGLAAEEAPKEATDPYESHKLRSDASERTKETFEKLKQAARERENAAKQDGSKLQAALEEMRKELATFKERETTLPKDVESELEELRAFRLAHDTENDPSFKEKFDNRRESNESTVYDILRRGGLRDTVLEQLKGLSYEERVAHITRWAEKLSPREKLLINSRLSDNETIELERARELKETKANASKILSDRKGPSPTDQQQSFVKEVVATLKPVLTQVPILHPKDIPANAAPKERQDLEEHNTRAAEYQSQLLNLLQDSTPATKGVLALAGVLAPYYRTQLQATQAQLKAAQTELGKIKQAGKLSRLSTSSATKGSSTSSLMDLPADAALDEMWKAMNPN